MRKEIVNIRIDERLIHGQIAATWVKALNATRIMVVDADAAKTEIQKIALKMACPPEVKLSILAPEKAAENLASGKYEADRILMVMKGTSTLKALHDTGLEMDTVNVGNMSGKEGTRPIKKAVNITPQDEAIFRSLLDKIHFTAQLVPTDTVMDFAALLD